MAKEGYLIDGGVKYYPVPSFHIGYILESAVEFNPGDYYGGTWELYGVGRVTVCVDTSQPEFNTIKKTGGEKTHKLIIEELPGFVTVRQNRTNGYGNNNWSGPLNGWGNYQNNRGDNTLTDQPHNNLQPYITVYRYVRIA